MIAALIYFSPDFFFPTEKQQRPIIIPIIGTKNDNTARTVLGLSSPFPIALWYLSVGTPQWTQTTASSSISMPHFLQKAIISPHLNILRTICPQFNYRTHYYVCQVGLTKSSHTKNEPLVRYKGRFLSINIPLYGQGDFFY